MIRVRKASLGYGGPRPILQDLDLDLGSGLTLVLGPNGAGKSSLLKLLAGVERPDSGAVELDGLNLWTDEIAARIGLAYISDQPELTPYATIRDVIDLVCRLRAEPTTAGAAALERAGLLALSGRSIRELSMGQRRRAVLAAAWVGSPRIVIMDEPLEAMDRAIRDEIVEWTTARIAAGAAVVIATHQVEPFARQVKQIVRLRDGRCEVLDSLPVDYGERLALLESSSRT